MTPMFHADLEESQQQQDTNGASAFFLYCLSRSPPHPHHQKL